MASGILTMAVTKIGAAAFGMMCRKIIFHPLCPIERAARTYSLSRRVRNSARTSLAVPVQLTRPITAMIIQIFGPRIAMAVRIRKNDGKQSNASTMRMSKLSIQPPKYPLTAPRNMPIPSETAMATNPTVREMVEPATMRERTSLPRLSVPSQFVALGGSNLASRFVALGAIGIGSSSVFNTPAAMATAKKKPIKTSATTANLSEKNFLATRRYGLSTAALAASMEIASTNGFGGA